MTYKEQVLRQWDRSVVYRTPQGLKQPKHFVGAQHWKGHTAGKCQAGNKQDLLC